MTDSQILAELLAVARRQEERVRELRTTALLALLALVAGQAGWTWQGAWEGLLRLVQG